MKLKVKEFFNKIASVFQKKRDAAGKDSNVKAKNWFKIEARIFIFCMLLFPCLSLIFFTFPMYVQSFVLPFQNYRTEAFTLDNWKTVWVLLTDPALGDQSLSVAIENTMMYFFWGIVKLPVCLFLTYFLFKRIAGRKAFMIIYNLPSVISGIVLTVAFKEITSQAGLLGTFMESIGKPLEQSIYKVRESANAAMVIYGWWVGLCGGVMYYYSAMNRIPDSVFEAAKLEGCGPFREAMQIVFPLISPTVMTQFLLSCTGILGSSGPLLLFTKGEYGTMTLSFFIYNKVLNDPLGDLGVVAAMGLGMTVLSLPLVLLVSWLSKYIPSYEY